MDCDCRPSRLASEPWEGNTCHQGFPGGSVVKQSARQCRRCRRPGFDPWAGKIPWRRKWPPTPVFSPGESHGQEPGGLQSMGSQRVRHNWATKHSMASWVPAEYAEYGGCLCLLQELAQQGAAESPWNGAQLPKDKVWLEPELNWQWDCLDATPKTKQQHFPRAATILVQVWSDSETTAHWVGQRVSNRKLWGHRTMQVMLLLNLTFVKSHGVLFGSCF